MWRWSDGGHRRSTYWLARQNHLSRILAGNSLIACGLDAIPLGKKKKSYIEIPNVEQSINYVSWSYKTKGISFLEVDIEGSVFGVK